MASIAADMASLDVLLLKGPPAGDVVGGLEQLRESVLSNGIPSNSDGMVSSRTNILSTQRLIDTPPVRGSHLHMVDTPEHSSSAYRCLP